MIKNSVRYSFLLIISLFITSCSYDKTVIELNGFFASTWSFDESAGYNFDPNQVEITNGQASLKKLDLEHSGADFENGNHVGSHVASGNIALTATVSEEKSDLTNILPTKTLNLIGYWKMENNWVDSSGKNNSGIPQKWSYFFEQQSGRNWFR